MSRNRPAEKRNLVGLPGNFGSKGLACFSPLVSAARLLGLVIAALAALVAGGPLWAASPQCNRIVPTGGQRGTEIEVQLIGARLGDSPQLLFFEPGLSVTSIQPADANTVKAKIAIAPDCRLGLHGLRIRTASGLSNLRLLAVGALLGSRRGRAERRFQPAAKNRARYHDQRRDAE